jgi:hypothetical protein
MLRGERSGARYQLAGRVRVKVVRVNLEQAKIDFTLVEQQGEAPAASARQEPGKKKQIPPRQPQPQPQQRQQQKPPRQPQPQPQQKQQQKPPRQPQPQPQQRQKQKPKRK